MSALSSLACDLGTNSSAHLGFRKTMRRSVIFRTTKTFFRTSAFASTVVFFLLAFTCVQALAQSAFLSSWNEGAAKKAITDFVARVTKQGSPDFVLPGERIATFDNDGTLWAEQPMYVQMAFVLDRVKELTPKHPEWKNNQPFKSVLEGDFKALAAQGEQGVFQLVMATHTGM